MARRFGWFKIKGVQDGDRTITEQLQGLGTVTFTGKTVIDVGCAEGIISKFAAEHGATRVHGLEIIGDHVEVARKLCRRLPCTFEKFDANNPWQRAKYDIVLLLSVLHKFRDPSAVCRNFAEIAYDTVVIRLPPSGPVIIDQRSNKVPHDIGAVMKDCGFILDRVDIGPRTEWVGIYRRISHAVA